MMEYEVELSTFRRGNKYSTVKPASYYRILQVTEKGRSSGLLIRTWSNHHGSNGIVWAGVKSKLGAQARSSDAQQIERGYEKDVSFIGTMTLGGLVHTQDTAQVFKDLISGDLEKLETNISKTLCYFVPIEAGRDGIRSQAADALATMMRVGTDRIVKAKESGEGFGRFTAPAPGAMTPAEIHKQAMSALLGASFAEDVPDAEVVIPRVIEAEVDYGAWS